jgi:alpha-glucosidase (family GH31 glycosyl hydrolase)
MLDFINIQFQPKAEPSAIVEFGSARFTILTPKLIRMEYDPNNNFEDRASQVFWFRKQPVPDFTHRIEGEILIIETESLLLTYQSHHLGFTCNTLKITQKATGYVWCYGIESKSNLHGTVRTLDEVKGAIPLNPGLISRNGWSLVDDSASLVFSEDGWLETRQAHPAAKDLYFFGYGHDYTRCIVDFQKVSGKVPILPRFALGNWWSRYWPYHQDELVDLMKTFRSHHVPISVCIVDMDWHLVDTGNESSGWTGYTWNPEYFPQPQQFLDEIHELGLRIALNLHPASGVYPHEAQYPEMAEEMGVDPESQQPVPFDIANRKFTDAYFRILHHPMEAMGVDFWWLDWQQGTKTAILGLDPLFWLNHLHFYDLARDSVKRPFIFSRWGGLGGQRYPIGFSGDTIVSWETLQFEPYFTATAANVGYGWWSHDIGGHMGGVEEAELYLRWVQYGVFSPIMRLHSTNNPYHERRPWGYDAETEIHAAEAMRLRHALIPYLYTSAWRNHREGILLIRPMYHLYPEENDAYLCPNEYTFGSELIAVPFTSRKDQNTNLSRQVVWFPEGDWFDFFSGAWYQGGGWYAVYGGLSYIPVFARSGAIIPLGPDADWDNIGNPDTLMVKVFPGTDGEFQLYEDDGETLAYEQGAFTITTFREVWQGKKLNFFIDPTEGNFSDKVGERIYNLFFYSLTSPKSVIAKLDGKELHVDWVYNSADHILRITDIKLLSTKALSIEITSSEELQYKEDSQKATLEKMLKVFRMNTYVKESLHKSLDELMTNSMLLTNYTDRMEKSQLLAFIETWLGKQEGRISQNPQEAFNTIITQIYGR